MKVFKIFPKICFSFVDQRFLNISSKFFYNLMTLFAKFFQNFFKIFSKSLQNFPEIVLFNYFLKIYFENSLKISPKIFVSLVIFCKEILSLTRSKPNKQDLGKFFSHPSSVIFFFSKVERIRSILGEDPLEHQWC